MEETNQAPCLSLIVKREAEMLSCAAKRVGWFMEPGGTPYAPSHHKAASFAPTRTASVDFRGWASVPRQWREWVEKLLPRYGDTWRKTGIYNAIISSTKRVGKDRAAILGVARFWCAETSSFIFPWGEATVTLQDISKLGDFPVLGWPVRGALEGRLKEMELKIEMQRREFNKSKAKKPAHSLWISHFMNGEADQMEHIAFLTLWLSRFVFPRDVVSANVIPVAIKISEGERIALAPAVLATLYRDLRSIKDHLNDNGNENESTLPVFAPFHLLQLWLWMRFKTLEPKELHNAANPMTEVCHNMRTNTEPCFVELILKSHEEFSWEPYSGNLYNIISTYEHIGGTILKISNYDGQIRAFANFLMASYLVGLDCIEKYLPHRVAKQFGLDQDVPGNISPCNSDWESAWRSYDINSCYKEVELYFPPTPHQPDVTHRYAVWWKQNMLGLSSREKGIAEVKRSYEELDDNLKLSELGARLRQRAHEKYDSVRFLEEYKRKSSEVELPIRQEKKATRKMVSAAEEIRGESNKEKSELQMHNKTNKENNDCANDADKQIEHGKKTQDEQLFGSESNLLDLNISPQVYEEDDMEMRSNKE